MILVSRIGLFLERYCLKKNEINTSDTNLETRLKEKKNVRTQLIPGTT